MYFFKIRSVRVSVQMLANLVCLALPKFSKFKYDENFFHRFSITKPASQLSLASLPSLNICLLK